MPEFPDGREVVLRKIRPMAPPFHRHIARPDSLDQLECVFKRFHFQLAGEPTAIVFEVAERSRTIAFLGQQSD